MNVSYYPAGRSMAGSGVQYGMFFGYDNRSETAATAKGGWQIVQVSAKIRITRKDQPDHMIRISSTEFGKEVGRYQDAALAEPVIVTRNGRDRTVIISAAEYRRLKQRDREVLGIEDFSDAEIAAIRQAQPSIEADAFNKEVEP